MVLCLCPQLPNWSHGFSRNSFSQQLLKILERLGDTSCDLRCNLFSLLNTAMHVDRAEPHDRRAVVEGADRCDAAATRARRRGAFRTFSLAEELRQQATTPTAGWSGATGSPFKSLCCGFEAADRFRVITMNRAERAGRRNRRNRARRRPTSQPPPRKKGTISTVPGTQGSAPGSRRSFSMSLARATVNLSAARARSLRGGDLRVPRRAVPVKSRRAVANTVSEMNKVRLRAPPRAIARRRRRDEVNPYLDAVP